MSVDAAVEALRSGKLAIVPTDTVYGLAAGAHLASAVQRLYRLKSRDVSQPTALVAADVEMLFECVPELPVAAGAIVRALLPGPYTLVVPNPGRRYPWLTGSTPEAIGVRVPKLSGPGGVVLERLGAYAASSANARGGPDPCSLAEVPVELKEAAAALVDGGELPGTPSTVLDLTGSEPRVLREGAVPAAEALRHVGSVL